MLLSICIPSYNRPHQLKRFLKSFVGTKFDELEILVVDDCSPMQDVITSEVMLISKSLPNFTYVASSFNLGYDQNLLYLANLAKSKFVLFCSDDDQINISFLVDLLDYLRHSSFEMAVTAMTVSGGLSVLRRPKSSRFSLNPTLSSDTSYCIYSLILFSGIIVNRALLVNTSLPSLSNLVYSQLIWGLLLSITNGLYFIDLPIIHVVGDGVNGFGLNPSSTDLMLSNRDDILAPIRYHCKLFSCLKIVEELSGISFVPAFSKEYSLRLVSGFSRALSLSGRSEFSNICVIFINALTLLLLML